MVEKADQFANPEDERSRAYNYHPISEPKRDDIEELTAKSHNQNLSDKDNGGDQDESTTILEVEGRASGGKSAGVEHIPELQEDEDGEKQG